jgi:hypothetical protein
MSPSLFPPPPPSPLARSQPLRSDGDIDVLAASINDNTVWYFDSSGGSSPTFTSRTVTTSSGGATAVFGEDYDTDGDVDVLVCGRVSGSIDLYANDGGVVPVWSLLTVSSTSGYPLAMALGDVSNDGTVDVVRRGVCVRGGCGVFG